MRRRWFALSFFFCSHIIIHFARFSTSVAPVPFEIYSSSTLYNNESTSHWEKKLAKVRALDQIAIKKKKIARALRQKSLFFYGLILISCASRLFATTRAFLRQVNLSKDRLYTFMFFAAIIFISFSLYFFFYKKTLLGTANSLYIKYFAYTRTIDINNEHDCHSSTAELLSRSN